MKKKLKLVVLIGCLLILVNMGIAGTSLADDPGHEQTQQGDPIHPVVLVHHADANGPYSGDVGEAISFSGSGTWMSTAGGLFYEWDFDDGTTGYGKYPNHIYSEPGVYYVTLTVQNGNGDVYKDIAPVYIERMADHLTPIGGCHYHGDAGETITFDASDSESTGAEIVQYFWDFGDGESAVGEQVTHSYDEERVYMVTLDVKDSNGFTRHDVLHADIGRSYTDDDDFFHNSPSVLDDILDLLLNRNNLITWIICNILDAQIYTKYVHEGNVIEKLTDYFGGELEINVNDQGAKDIKVNDLEFFKARKTTSMFDDHSRVWYQFETTLSHITKISSEITAADDFTICLQLNLGIISNYLDLDDTIMRVGYNSPADQELPNDIKLVHILRPYLLFRMFGFLNNQNVECGQVQGIATAVVYTNPATVAPQGVPGVDPLDGGEGTTGSGTGGSAPIGSPDGGEVQGDSQSAGSSQPAQPLGNGNDEYWPEYGLELRNTGAGGSYSLMTEFLGTSTTTAKITTDPDATSTFMYKRKKIGGLLNHATVFEIPGDSATFSAYREKNGAVTELSTEFSFSGNLVRGLGWSDAGVYFGILGDTEVSLNNFYFNNSGATLDIGEISLDTHGSFNFNLNQEAGLKVDLDGSLGFGISDLYFDSTNLDVNIIGDFAMEVTSPAHFALGAGVLEAGFTGTLGLYTDAIFEVNGQAIGVGGDFELEADGIIKFTWNSNEFNIDLDAGGELTINNLHFEVGDLNASAAEIGIEADGQFDIEWVNQEVTISGGSGASLYLRDVDIIINNRNSLYIRIIGDLTVEADGEITFGPDVFKAEFSGLLDLGTSVEFEINGESIIVGGKFSFDTGNGEIIFSWENGDFSLDVSSNFELSIENLYFEVGFDTGDLIVNSELVELGLNGEFNVISDNGEVTISGAGGASLGVQNLTVSLTIGNPDLTIQIIGWFEVEANGWVTFGSGVFEAGFDGTLDLGTATQFVINGEGVTVGGVFSMTGVNNEISFLWDGESFTFGISGNNDITVQNFYFEVDDIDLLITADEVGIGISGQLLIDWDTSTNQITISSGNAGVSFDLTNLYVEYSNVLTVEIIGYFEIEANGYLKFGPDLFEVSFSGTLDLGGQTQFIINGDGITVGGQFTLSSGNGQIGFTWDSATKEFSLYVSGSPSVSVSNLYFNAGDITVEAENVEIGANGEFNLDWDTTTNEVTFSSGGGVSLGIENVSLVYGTTINASITGSLTIQAEGDITLAPGVLEASFSGTLDFGTSCIFEINGNSLTVGGQFAVSVSDGDISFSWSDTQLTLDFSGSSTLTVTNFYFKAGDLTITGDEVEIEVSGQFDVSLDTANNKVTISSGTSGISLYIENVEITYGTTLNVEIIGSFELEANGWLTFGDGVFEAGFSGSLTLSDGFGFEINSELVKLEGLFNLQMGSGDITISWSEDELYCDLVGGMFLSIEDFYFEIEQLKINAERAEIGFNGDFTITIDKSNKKFEIESDLFFGFNGLIVNINDNSNWHQICSVNQFSIGGGGYVLVDSNSEIVVDFNGQLTINSLQITPPSNWNADLYIGSASLIGNAELYMEKDTFSGDGKFVLSALSGDISGQISNFDAYILLGSNDLDVSFWNFQIDGAFSINLDDIHDDLQVSASGSIDLLNFNAEYGNFDISTNIELNGDGSIATSWDENSLDIDADVDFVWDIWLDSSIIGEWEAQGNLVGSADVSAEWQDESGSIEVDINSPGVFHSLEITHDDLTLTLWEFTITPGTITFDWQSETTGSPGEIYIDNTGDGVEGSLTLFKLTWGTKIFKVEGLSLESGQFKFTWDTNNNEVTVRNGIFNLGPTFSYEDGGLKISLSFMQMTSNYQKVITLRWYEDAQGNIYGGYIDTDNQELAQLVEFEVTSGSKGVSIALYGLKATDFSIQKISGEWQLSGDIQIANRLTVGLMWSYEWHELDLQWDLTGEAKEIRYEYTCDDNEPITFRMLDSFEILGWDFDVELTLYANRYLWVEFDFAVNDNFGHIKLDTGNQWVGALTFEITKGDDYDIEIILQALKAGEYGGELPLLYWRKSPWAVGKNTAWNMMQWTNLEVWALIDGTWKQVWPIT